MPRVGQVADVAERAWRRSTGRRSSSSATTGADVGRDLAGGDVDALPEPAKRRPAGGDRQVPPAQLAEGLLVRAEQDGVDERPGWSAPRAPGRAGMSAGPGSNQSGALSDRNFHSGMSSSGATSGSARNGRAQARRWCRSTRSTTTGARDGGVDAGSDRVGERAEVRQRRAGGDRGLVTYDARAGPLRRRGPRSGFAQAARRCPRRRRTP